MKNLTLDIVVAIVCLAFSFAGLVVLAIVMTDMRTTLILILSWYILAIIMIYGRKRRLFHRGCIEVDNNPGDEIRKT